MSFGQSYRFSTQTEGGKVQIFWDQAAKANKPKKKFSYKKKAQPFPLRGATHNDVATEQETVKHQTTVKKSVTSQRTPEKVPANDKLRNNDSEIRPRSTQGGAAVGTVQQSSQDSQQISNGDIKHARQSSNNKEKTEISDGAKTHDYKTGAAKSVKTSKSVKTLNDSTVNNNKKTQARNDRARLKGQKGSGSQATVTLTQAQLNAILETIGKVSNGTVEPVRISVDKENQDIKIEKVELSGKDTSKQESNSSESKEVQSAEVSKTQPDESKNQGDETNTLVQKGGIYDLLKTSDQSKQTDTQVTESDNTEQRGGIYALLNKTGNGGDQSKVVDNKSNKAAPENQGGNISLSNAGKLRVEPVRVQPTSVPGLDLGNDSTKDFQSNETLALKTTHDSARGKVEPAGGQNVGASNLGNIPKAHLTKGEQKRLQWERERVEIERIQQQVHKRESATPRQDSAPVTAKAPAVQKSISGPPLSKAEQKRIQWDKERADAQKRDSEARSSANYETNAIVNDGYIVSPRHVGNQKVEGHVTLSKAEQKRLQWEKERAEMREVEKHAVDPWGKPGAGAPVRSDSGRVLTDYNSRLANTEETVEAVALVTDNGSDYGNEQVLRMSQEKNKSSNQAPSHPGDTTQTITPRVVSNANVPAAMRSNFVFGGEVVDGTSNKELEKRKWLEDLEKQREEKRLLKVQEKSHITSEPQTWADKMGGYKPVGLPEQQSVIKDDLATVPRGGASLLDERANSAPQGPLDTTDHGHARGRITNLDASTQRELEERRRRHLEHQKAIQEQVEERQRLKREERERKAREEAEEERRLQKERDVMKLQFELEQEKAKKKEQREEQRIQALKEAMDRAKEEAIRDKKEKRLQNLQRAGHDVSHLRASMEEELSPRAPAINAQPQSVHVQPTHVPGLNLSPRPVVSQSVVVAPTSVPGLDLSPRRSRDVAQQREPYTENRVLTPTQHRHGNKMADPSSPMREFGTQTESGEVSIFKFANDDSGVEIEYKPKSKTKAKQQGKNTRRATSAEKANSGKQRGKPTSIKERPSWGVKAAKPVKKMSERDPNFERRKQQREQNRLERAAKMKAIQEANEAKLAAFRNPNKGKAQVTLATEGNKITPRADSPPIPTLRQEKGERGNMLNGYQNKNTVDVGQDGGATQRTRRGDKSDRRTTTRSVQKSPSPVRSETRSPPVPALHSRIQGGTQSHASPSSPPVPAVKNKAGQGKSFNNDYSMSQYDYDAHARDGHQKKLSPRIERSPSPSNMDGTEFVPFLRSEAVLDPSHAESPVPVSRESSAQQRARVAYYQTHEPASYGKQLENYKDEHYGHMIPPESKDPILNPRLVTDHPTNRQGIILKQLSEMRKGLLQKQREIESCLSPSELTASRVIREDDYL